jgi:PIN domain nuclease of toxin-antitoxin system
VLVLLDTHVWIWHVHGEDRRVGRRTRSLLGRAESQDCVRISPATLFELTALHTVGRIRLTRPPAQWIHDALEAAGARIAELTTEMAIHAGLIPRTALADPLDRLLVATASQLEATFLTSDARILEYASTTRVVRVHNAAV